MEDNMEETEEIILPGGVSRDDEGMNTEEDLDPRGKE